MSYIPQRSIVPPASFSIGCGFGCKVGGSTATSKKPRQLESYDKPKPKDPRTIIGWALKSLKPYE